jgi:hypothetical protein
LLGVFSSAAAAGFWGAGSAVAGAALFGFSFFPSPAAAAMLPVGKGAGVSGERSSEMIFSGVGLLSDLFSIGVPSACLVAHKVSYPLSPLLNISSLGASSGHRQCWFGFQILGLACNRAIKCFDPFVFFS